MFSNYCTHLPNGEKKLVDLLQSFAVGFCVLILISHVTFKEKLFKFDFRSLPSCSTVIFEFLNALCKELFFSYGKVYQRETGFFKRNLNTESIMFLNLFIMSSAKF